MKITRAADWKGANALLLAAMQSFPCIVIGASPTVLSEFRKQFVNDALGYQQSVHFRDNLSRLEIPGSRRVTFVTASSEVCRGQSAPVVIIVDALGISNDFLEWIVSPMVAKGEKVFGCEGQIVMA